MLAAGLMLAVARSAPAGPAPGSFGAGDGSESSVIPQVLMAAGVVVLVLTVVRAVRRRASRPTVHDGSPRERLDAIKADAQSRSRPHPSLPEGTMDPVTAATELASILDARSVRVEQLLADLDERIDRLERLEGGSGEGSRGLDQTEHRDDAGGAARAERPGSSAAAAAGSDSWPVGGPVTGDERRRLAIRIHELSAEGLDALAIARELGAPIGEVELVRALGPAVAGVPASEPEPGEQP